MRLSSQRGVAMVVALTALVLVAGIGTLLFSRTLNEMRHSRDDAAIVQTLLLARGGSNVAGALLANDVNVLLRDAVRYTSTPGPWVFGEGSGDTPTASSVISRLTAVINRLQPAVDGLICDEAIVPTDTGAEIQLRLYFSNSACGVALPSDVRLPAPRYVSGPRRNADGAGVQTYALPFVLVSEATLGEYRRNIVTQGEYRFEVGQANFSMWAYFTNREVSRDYNGRWVDKIYFTDATMIDGPVHTNGHFALAYDPWFGGSVSSAGCNDASCSSIDRGAYLYNYEHTEQYNCRWIDDPDAWEYYRHNSGDFVRLANGNYVSYSRWSHSGMQRYHRRRPSPRPQIWVCDTRNVDLIPDTVLGSSPNFGGNAPIFAGGVGWDSPRIDLPENNFRQRDIAQGVDRADEGLYFNSALHRLEFFAGTDATWTGNMNSVTPTLVNNVWTPPATYQYVRGCTTSNNNSCTVYRINAAGVVEQYSGSTWTVRSSGRQFNGVIYVNGDIDRFTGPSRTTANNSDTAPPALASFAQITLASNHDIRITGDIKYESPPCSSIPVRNSDRTVESANCTNLTAQNVLGVYTQAGDVIVGHGHTGSGSGSLNAPDNVQVHAVLMSAENEVRVENYQRTDAGGFFLMGGMIQERRGIFGTFSGRGSSATRTGFDRIYTYDPRMARGMAPPFFPSTNVDDVTTVTFFTFGQREQLYN